MEANEEIKDIDQEILEQMLPHFLPEARENLDHLNLCLIQMEESSGDESLVDTVFRIFHTLKGGAGFAGLESMSTLARAFEELMGDVRKGNVKIGPSGFNVIYEGMDVFSDVLDRAEAGDKADADITEILAKIDKIRANEDPECDCDPDALEDGQPTEQEELLAIYRHGYHQLGTLKHLIYESVSLSDPESLAVLLSNQIHERMAPERNGFWLLEGKNTLVEIARNGELVGVDERRSLKVGSSDVIDRVILEQVTMWPSESESISTVLPEYESPVIFPIKSKPSALGMLILDPEETTEVELYQFISQFAAMIMRISALHRKVDEQRAELDEMTEILFRQNAQLSSLYHVEMSLVKESDPVKLCDIVVKAIVEDLEASRAMAFLYDPETQEIHAASAHGELDGVVGKRFGSSQIPALAKCLETGRIITQTDFGEPLEIGSNRLDGWIALGLKGRESVRGLMVAEVDDEDIADPISILTNYLGILLDNIALKEKVQFS